MGPGELVIGLADALVKEVRGGRGPSLDEDVEAHGDSAATSSNRPEELEVLEQHVAVVAGGAEDRRPKG
jgi:hypothetical protein